MSYYRRPMGDYKTYGYAGDPGFLSGIWKGIKAVGKVLLGVPPTPPVVPAVGAGVAGAIALSPPTFMPGAGARGPSMPDFQFPASGPQWGGGGPTRGSVAPIGGACPVGYHMEKSGRGYCVRNRRMNVANPRALRRGMRRVQGFEKLAKRTISFTRRVKIKKRAS